MDLSQLATHLLRVKNIITTTPRALKITFQQIEHRIKKTHYHSAPAITTHSRQQVYEWPFMQNSFMLYSNEF